MADQEQKRPRYRREVSPGLSGAIKDAVAAVSEAVAPRSIVQRRAKLKLQEEEMSGQRRRREGQSTDSNNGY